MADWKTYQGQVPWTNIPVEGKTTYNEGDRISSINNPTWDADHEFSGVPVTDTHIPCGYWSKEYVPILTPSFGWVQMADIPPVGVLRMSATAIGVGSRIFVGLGKYGADVTGERWIADWWEYIVVQNRWEQRVDFGGGVRKYAMSASIGGKIYVGGGSSDTGSQKDWWEYDPEADTWTQKADFIVANANTVAVGCGTKVYVGMYSYDNQDWYEYNPADDTWTQKTDFPGTAVSSAVGAELNGFVYVGLGYYPYGNRSKDWWKYDPSDDSWVEIACFSTGYSHSIAVSANSKIYAGTGIDSWRNYRGAWMSYDPDTNLWSSEIAFGRRYSAIVASADGKIFAGTGYTDLAPESGRQDWWRFT